MIPLIRVFASCQHIQCYYHIIDYVLYAVHFSPVTYAFYNPRSLDLLILCALKRLFQELTVRNHEQDFDFAKLTSNHLIF